MTWSDLAQHQHGIIARHQLRADGLVDRTITRLIDRRELWPLCDGLFLVRGAPLTYTSRAWGAVLLTEGVLGFGTAGYLWEQVPHRPSHVHVCVDHPVRSHAPDWIVLHRVAVPGFARTTREGLAITSPSWTLFDLVGDARRDSDASQLLDRGLQRNWATRESLAHRLKCTPGRSGNVRLRALLDQLGDGAAAESERRLHLILRQGGVVGWVPNYRIVVDGGDEVFADVALPALRLLIEIDGWAHHSDVDRFRRDRHRQNSLISAGWTVLRFTWADVTERPSYVLATIQNFGAHMDAS